VKSIRSATAPETIVEHVAEKAHWRERWVRC
jgi:hypothetical protein